MINSDTASCYLSIFSSETLRYVASNEGKAFRQWLSLKPSRLKSNRIVCGLIATMHLKRKQVILISIINPTTLLANNRFVWRATMFNLRTGGALPRRAYKSFTSRIPAQFFLIRNSSRITWALNELTSMQNFPSHRIELINEVEILPFQCAVSMGPVLNNYNW